MIRFICLNGFIAVHTIIFCLWGFLLSLFSRNGRLVHFYAAVPWAKAILWVSGIRVSVTGLEHIDLHQPRIYMTNHQSYFDIFALLAYLPVEFKFIMKQELMKIPILGFSMRRVGYIGIEREDPRQAVQLARSVDRIFPHQLPVPMRCILFRREFSLGICSTRISIDLLTLLYRRFVTEL